MTEINITITEPCDVLACYVSLFGWPLLEIMLARAYSHGYKTGHNDTVEGIFCGNGRSEEHIEMALEWVNDNLEIFSEGVYGTNSNTTR